MIPLRLTLRNFMSYGEEGATLDFTGMHVACLTGDNGNGKSALLDAMTYALWGKTRASGSQASGEDDLIRLGAEEMEVRFEFRLGDDVYCAIRKRSRRSRAADWQVWLRDGGGEWRPAGGSGMRDTERALTRLLRMQYETFLNSAYIQQGHADEFTRQKPDARKRILADILGLSRYDRLEEMARERRNDADLRLRDLEGEVRALGAGLGHEVELRERLDRERTELEATQANRAACEEALTAVRERLAALEQRRDSLLQRERRLRDIEEDQRELCASIERLERQMAEAEALLAEAPALRESHARLLADRARAEELQPIVEALHAVERESERLKSALALRRREAETAVETARRELAEAEEQARRIAGWEQEAARIAAQRAALGDVEAERTRVRTELAAAQETFSGLRARRDRLEADIQELAEVVEALQQPLAACPVCAADLSGGKREAVIAKQAARLERARADVTTVKREGLAVKQRRDALQAEAEALEARARTAAELESRRGHLRTQRDEALRRHTDPAERRAALEKASQALQQEAYGAEERQGLQAAERRIATLRTGSEEYERVQIRLREAAARQVEARHARLQEAERLRAHGAEERDALEARRVKRAGQIEQERGILARARTEIEASAKVEAEVRSAQAAFREADALCSRQRESIARLEHDLERLDRDRTLAAAKGEEHTKLQHDRQAYHDLAAAFGKRGLQALIIENALPEIQEEANRLLARMSDNAMQIGLSTLRTARSTASAIETLDITITDDAGTRPYEMYSGGEAFRINFALRIALSRLLARHAGARLQTLVLDEGFGTQDATGRIRLVEAIEAVRDEFALILVISHVEELKDAFPSRIEIVKTAAGSQIHQLG